MKKIPGAGQKRTGPATLPPSPTHTFGVDICYHSTKVNLHGQKSTQIAQYLTVQHSCSVILFREQSTYPMLYTVQCTV